MTYQGLLSKIVLLLIIGSVGGCADDDYEPPPVELEPEYDFSAVDARFQKLIDESETLDGISVTLVDQIQGTTHEASFGDHTPEIVVLLGSTSQFVSATLMMAIDEDDSINFDVDTPIGNYLAWEGVYGDPTATQLLSNTSGIPGSITGRPDYGVHECQYNPEAIFEDCAKLIYSTELPETQPPGTIFDYGGSQWHLAGAVATQVTNSEWNQAFDSYITQPCGLQVFEYGNMVDIPEQFTGQPGSVVGRGNPHPSGGGIANLQDMARLLLLHVRNGMCDDTRVLSAEAVAFMQVDRKEGLDSTIPPWSPRAYGMGWWGRDVLPDVFYSTGTFGSIAWIDTKRSIGGFVAVDAYGVAGANSESWNLVLDEIIPLVGQLVDEARAAAQ